MGSQKSVLDAFNKVVDFVLEKGCPCAFPRVLFLLTFDPEKFGISPTEVECTQALIQRCVSHSDENGIIVGPSDKNKICKKCSSIYQLHSVEYSLTMSYVTLEILQLNTPPVGAAVTHPIPLAGTVRSWKNPKGQDIFLKLFSNANTNPEEFVRYMISMV